jgi:hypothetical protein
MSEESRSKVWTNYQEALAARSFVFNLDLSNQVIGPTNEQWVCTTAASALENYNPLEAERYPQERL